MAKRKYSGMKGNGMRQGGGMSYEHKRDLGGQRYDPQADRDSGMVSERQSLHANLPTEVIMREYPMAEYADFPYLDDTIKGADNRMKEDKRGMNKGMGRDIKY